MSIDTATYRQAELLQQAFNHVVWAYGRSQVDPHGVPRAESRLFDACIEAGMDHEEPCPVEWAAIQIDNAMAVL